ncbi:unnamed protein product, partial [Staurois parvus]
MPDEPAVICPSRCDLPAAVGTPAVYKGASSPPAAAAGGTAQPPLLPGMASRSRRSWLSVLLGLVLGFLIASRLILPWAADFQRYSRRGGGPRGVGQAGGGSCGVPAGTRSDRNDQLPYIGSRAPGGEEPGGEAAQEEDIPRDRTFLFIGVMTAQKYLHTRAVAAYRTWSQFIPGKVEFFSSEGSDMSIPIPIIALKGVDDSYPPQKKSFMMLKYMHDHYLDQYEWFMRADDDVYIKGDRLESFLRS